MPAAASSALTLQTMPVLVARKRRDDRHLAADEDRVEEVAPEPDDVGDEAQPGTRSAMSSPPSTPDSPTASTPRSRSAGDQLAVDDAAQHGRGDFQRGLVGDAQAALEVASRRAARATR